MPDMIDVQGELHLSPVHSVLSDPLGVNISFEDFIAILKANGHDAMRGETETDSYRFDSQEHPPNIRHEGHRKAMLQAIESEVEAGMEWGNIKGTSLVIDGDPKVYRNPYEWRGWFTQGDSQEWVEPFRKSGASKL